MIQFLPEGKRLFEVFGLTRVNIEEFRRFESPCSLRAFFEFVQSISCRLFESTIKSLLTIARRYHAVPSFVSDVENICNSFNYFLYETIFVLNVFSFFNELTIEEVEPFFRGKFCVWHFNEYYRAVEQMKWQGSDQCFPQQSSHFNFEPI